MRYMLPLLRCWHLFTLLVGVHTAYAEVAFDAKEAAQQTINSGNKTIAVILERFTPLLPEEKRYLANPQRVRVVVAANFGAFANYKDGRILIPAQFVGETLLQVQAILAVRKNPSLAEKYQRWVRYLSRRSQAALLKHRTTGASRDDTQVDSFFTAENIPMPASWNVEELSLQAAMMTDFLAFVVGHELGHLVLNHKGYTDVSPETSRQQETAADEFAATLLNKSGYSALPGLGTFFMRFAENEILEKSAITPEQTHPLAACRVYRLYKRELPQLTNSSGGQAELKRMTGMSKENFEAKIEVLRSACDQ